MSPIKFNCAIISVAGHLAANDLHRPDYPSQSDTTLESETLFAVAWKTAAFVPEKDTDHRGQADWAVFELF